MNRYITPCLFAIFIFQIDRIYALGLSPNSVVNNNNNLVLVDGFTEYISGECRTYCSERGIRLFELISPYMCEILQLQQKCEVPDYLKAPIQEHDILEWAQNQDLLYPVANANSMTTCVIAESDSGVSTAEKMATILNLPSNGMSPHLRNKFESNIRAQHYGRQTVKQKLAYTLNDALEFVKEMWNDEIEIEETNANPHRCIVKPYRGVASDGVYLCESFEDVEVAFNSLFGKPKYGGGANEAVLIQEYAEGPEYAVDTVAMDGDIKVVALWRYHKLAINGAPFVYQCSELIAANDDETEAVCDYCIDILKAQNLKWGPTHTEIRNTVHGPRLIEINARWHAQNFIPIVRSCLGYDAVFATLDAYFDQDKFRALPERPRELKGAGRILHLISHVEGQVEAINYMDLIKGLPSTLHLSIEPEVGGNVVKTVDIRTDCGYVLQYHEDPDVVRQDFDTILALQPTLFDIKTKTIIIGDDEEEKENIESTVVVPLKLNEEGTTTRYHQMMKSYLSQKTMFLLRRFILIGLSTYGACNIFVVFIPLIFAGFS